MALSFPVNPTLGQGYQSGSSATYQYDGVKWVTVTPPTQTTLLATSASFVAKKTISNIISNPGNGAIFIVDGVPCIIRGSNNTAYVAGTGLLYPGPMGATNMHEIPLPPAESGSIQDIGVCGNQAYILFSNGNLYGVGQNNRGQFGLGDTTERTVYTLINTNVTKFFNTPSTGDRASGDGARFIIQKSDGKVYGAGYNEYGQLGLGNATATISTWTEMTWCGTNPMSVWNMGNTIGCTFCQKSDGTVFAAGWNNEGNLGNGSTATAVSTAVNVTNNWLGGTFAATGMVIQQVLGGYGFYDGSVNNEANTTMFLDNGTTSRIASAGYNGNGTLGDASFTNRSTPVTPSGFSGRVRQIGRVGGNYGSVHVVKTDNTYWNWGRNLEGQLGRGNTTTQNTPAQVRTDVLQMFNENWASNTTSYICSSPILETATAYFIAGSNLGGYLGVGDATLRNAFTQMRFPGGTRLSKTGQMATINELPARYAVDTNNVFYTWGENSNNAVIDTTTVDITVPLRVQVPELER